MKKFAKVFETKTTQVLVVTSYNDDHDSFELRQTAYHNGIEASITSGFKAEEKCDKAFADYSQIDANKYVKTIKKLLK